MITKSQHKNIGQLDKRVTFRFYGTTDDGMGGTIPDSTPTDVLTTWASIKTLSGEEFLSQGALQSNITHRLYVRRRSDLVSKGYARETYDNLLQAESNGKIYNINTAINLDEDDRFVEMMATHEQGDAD